jgi:hypothetical protein
VTQMLATPILSVSSNSQDDMIYFVLLQDVVERSLFLVE